MEKHKPGVIVTLSTSKQKAFESYRTEKEACAVPYSSSEASATILKNKDQIKCLAL